MSKSSDPDAETIPVVEEQLVVARRNTVTGLVRLKKRVHQEDKVVDEPLRAVEIEVERVPVGRWVDAPLPVRREGNTTIYPVLEEVAVIEKRLRLVEEVRVTRKQLVRHSPEPVSVRREEVTVERVRIPAASGEVWQVRPSPDRAAVPDRDEPAEDRRERHQNGERND